MRVIGITMREVAYAFPSGHVDPCDALSHSWGRFCSTVGLAWLPLPNRGEETLALVKHLDLAGIILTGGGDVGKQMRRDMTEQLLLTWAQKTGRPLLGVCRGFQFIQCALGGQLVECDANRHVAHKHKLRWVATQPMPHSKDSTVNSFHNWGIQHLAPSLQALAICEEDSTVEAAYADNIMGVMWHPERELVPSALSVQLMRWAFY